MRSGVGMGLKEVGEVGRGGGKGGGGKARAGGRLQTEKAQCLKEDEVREGGMTGCAGVEERGVRKGGAGVGGGATRKAGQRKGRESG